ncbi:hypothetical protein [Mesorhizobium sp. WSM3224]|nr:hypothetical protein [Mesorhizobium sp. WSM3224]
MPDIAPASNYPLAGQNSGGGDEFQARLPFAKRMLVFAQPLEITVEKIGW